MIIEATDSIGIACFIPIHTEDVLARPRGAQGKQGRDLYHWGCHGAGELD